MATATMARPTPIPRVEHRRCGLCGQSATMRQTPDPLYPGLIVHFCVAEGCGYKGEG